MKPKFCFWWVFLALSTLIDGTNGRTNLTFSHYSDNETNTYELFFMVETFTLNASHIVFVVTARTRGWVGLGLGPYDNISESDMVIGGYDAAAQEFYVFDKHGLTDEDVVVSDTKSESDWSMAHGNESRTGVPQTVLTYYRRYKTFDPNEGEDMEIKNEELYFHWCFGEDDDVEKEQKYGGSSPITFNLLIDGISRGSGLAISLSIVFSQLLLWPLILFWK